MTINPIPVSHDQWLDEIARAYNEALEAIPFGALAGAEMKPENLFHLAPAICLNFRGLKRTKGRLKKATDAVLASYTATLDENGKFPGSSIGSFAFGYLAAHFGLDLAKEAAIDEVMQIISRYPEKLADRVMDPDNFGTLSKKLR